MGGVRAGVLTVLAALTLAAPAGAATTRVVSRVALGGDTQRITYRYGPLVAAAGQNLILAGPVTIEKPPRQLRHRIAATMVDEQGRTPPVEQVHMHHAVFLNLGRRDVSAPSLPGERFYAFAGEDDRHHATGLRLPRRRPRHVGHQLHAPQRDPAEPGGVPGVHDRRRPEGLADRAHDDRGAPAVDRHGQRQRVPRLRRAQGRRRGRTLDLPRRRAPRAAAGQRVPRRPPDHAAGHRRPRAPRRPVDRPRPAPRRPDPAPVPLRGAVLRPQRPRVVGHGHDVPRRTGGWACSPGRAAPQRDLRHDARLLVRVDGPEHRLLRRRRRARPVRHPAGDVRRGHPRPAAGVAEPRRHAHGPAGRVHAARHPDAGERRGHRRVRVHAGRPGIRRRAGRVPRSPRADSCASATSTRSDRSSTRSPPAAPRAPARRA